MNAPVGFTLHKLTGSSLANLDLTADIFDSIREDYPEFDAWFKNTVVNDLDNRLGLAFVAESTGAVAGIALIKVIEDVLPTAGWGEMSKLSTFKIADDYLGLSLGQTLLDEVFRCLEKTKQDNVFVEVFPKHKQLLTFLESNTFFRGPVLTERGEVCLSRNLCPF